jgi:hypothetical protein
MNYIYTESHRYAIGFSLQVNKILCFNIKINKKLYIGYFGP